MNGTDEQLRRIEKRLEALEAEFARARDLYARFMAGPGRRLARMLGIEVPR